MPAPARTVSNRGRASDRERSIDVTDELCFRSEQLAIASDCWNLIGFTEDLEDHNAWVTAAIGGVEVFVQRFGETLRGFENYCAHRYFPLRNVKKGLGPIRCGLHGWLYDEHGSPAAIPLCDEAFGCRPAEINRSLRPIDVAISGPLVFGRLRRGKPASAHTLADHLGPIVDFLSPLATGLQSLGEIEQRIAANWKLCYQITLDDYHLVSVHPDSLGRWGHPRREEIKYFSFGRNSALVSRPESGLDISTEELLALSKPISSRRVIYVVFNIFPNLLVSLSRDGTLVVSCYNAVKVGETQHVSRVYYAPRGEGTWLSEGDGQARLLATRRICEQDQRAVELLQKSYALGRGIGLLGAREQRIGTFLDDVQAMDREGAAGRVP